MSDTTSDWPYDDIPPPPPRLERPRAVRTGRLQVPRNQAERDAWAAARWTLNGWTYQQIAEALGLTAKSTAHDCVQRGLYSIREATEAEVVKARAAQRARLAYVVEKAHEVLETKHVTISYGQIMKDDDGKPLIDDGPALAAIDRIIRASESLRKLDGLDAPAAMQVEHSGQVSQHTAEMEDLLRAARARAAERERELRDGSSDA